MADSKLLKEAIADAKAVKETAIANAKIALEEAFKPKLESMLSRELQEAMEDEDEDEDLDEALDSSEIGNGMGSDDSGENGKEPAAVAKSAHTELDPETTKSTATKGEEDSNYTKTDDLMEADETGDAIDDPTNADDAEMDESVDLELESIIAELENELTEGEEEDEDEEMVDEAYHDDEDEDHIDESADEEDEDHIDESADEEDDDIDLDEVLREMGYGDDEEEDEAPVDESRIAELEESVRERDEVIFSLQETINEVNLLNAKLLYANKLIKNHNMTNEQKTRVIETLDRTKSVREVKLVYTTLSEAVKLHETKKVSAVKKNITEGFASKTVTSTNPTSDEAKGKIITEATEGVNRFQKLAGIVK